ncbi:MAG: lipopolysaccharide transport periplasmic protein LptA [Motiliproteus sp.]
MNPINRCLLVCSWLFFSHNSLALPDDKQQPIQISADNAQLDDNSGTAVYTGSVKLVQGSLELEADKLTLHTNDAGDISLLVANGKPAHFQQLHQADSPLTHGYGLTVEFDVLKNILTLTSEAKLLRASDSFTGNQIQIDTTNNVIQAFSDQKQPNSRVEMVIQPRNTAPKPATKNQAPASQATPSATSTNVKSAASTADESATAVNKAVTKETEANNDGAEPAAK